ncbi:MAG: CRISPR-associated helicase Cas3' [Thermoprotei archaeon]|nr:MAG: CRISPR-associated helicase Cas3' [Thermoprotei archaeon]
MLDMSVTTALWGVVEKVVEKRGRKLVKYNYFEDLWDALNEGVGLTIVRAPTGCGKTEAVTAPFLASLREGERRWLSLIYALPTRSLSIAMRRRLSRALSALGVKWCTVTLDHGELWSVKPYLEGDVVVTTYDTLLYQFYGSVRPGYHVLLPMSKVLCSLVVLDEVQLLQDTSWYALSLLPSHLRSLLYMGVRVVMLSATIPQVLISEIARVLKEAKLPLSRIWAEPLRLVDSLDKPLRGRLDVELARGQIPSEDKLLLELLKEYEMEERLPALIVVNKVEKAVAVYRSLLRLRKRGALKRALPMLLHSRLKAGARRKVEELFEGWRAEADRIILVATQVVEAGLDLDVRLLLTELSPIDSLIQRLGRCARKRDGKAVVFTDARSGISVYPEVLLRKTLEEIEGREEELRSSVCELSIAQEFVDSVYTCDAIEMLRSRVARDLEQAISWISNYPNLIFARVGHERPSSPLLRLGYEVCCLLPSRSEYTSLLSGEEVCLKLSEYEERMVRLPVRSPREELPAVIHDLEGSRVSLILEAKASGGLLRLNARPMKPCEALSLAASRRHVLLLNPDYYEFYEGADLGVVNPWRLRE